MHGLANNLPTEIYYHVHKFILTGRPYPFRTQLNSMPVHIESLQCSGEEFRILDCHHVVANSSSMCTYNSDLLATCIPGNCSVQCGIEPNNGSHITLCIKSVITPCEYSWTN